MNTYSELTKRAMKTSGTEARVLFLAARFLQDRPRADAEPICRTPIPLARIVRVVAEARGIGAEIATLDAYGHPVWVASWKQHPLALAIEAWSAIPESKYRRYERECRMRHANLLREERRTMAFAARAGAMAGVP